jgi:hypothetical protein
VELNEKSDYVIRIKIHHLNNINIISKDMNCIVYEDTIENER